MEDEVGTNSLSSVVKKGKRTKRQRPQSPHPGARACSVANNSSPPANPQEAAASCESIYSRSNGAASMATSAPIASSDQSTFNTEEEEEMANCLIMLAQGRRFGQKFTSRRFLEASPDSGSGGCYVYECRTCSKTFPSFQALGGHRASHKKPRLLPPTKDEESSKSKRISNQLVSSDDDEITTPDNHPPPAPAIKVNRTHFSPCNSLSLQLTNRALYSNDNAASASGNKQRVHECSICGAEFSSGQALGGHMRRHRGPAVGGSQTAPIASLSLTLHPEEDPNNALSSKKPSLDLDLNLPAIPDADQVNRSDSKLVFAPPPPQPLQGEPQPPPPTAQPHNQQLGFPPPALVDCHY